MFENWGHVVYRRRLVALLIALVAVVGAAAVWGPGFGTLQRTGGIITSAALLLIVVVAAFATSGIIFIKLLGVGMIIALVVDATVVRYCWCPRPYGCSAGRAGGHYGRWVAGMPAMASGKATAVGAVGWCPPGPDVAGSSLPEHWLRSLAGHGNGRYAGHRPGVPAVPVRSRGDISIG